MIHYAENRVYPLYSSMTDSQVLPEEIQFQPNQIDPRFSAGARFRMTPSKLDTTLFLLKSAFDCLKFEPNQKALSELGKILHVDNEIELMDFSIKILSLGFLSVTSVHRFNNIQLAMDFEEIGLKIMEKTDSLFKMIETLVDETASSGVIKKSKNYHFGIPDFLEDDLAYAYDDNCYFNQHLFIDHKDQSIAEKVMVKFNFPQNGIYIDGWNFFSGWSLYLWTGNDGPIPDTDFMGCDTIHLCTTATCSNSISCYTESLRAISERGESIKPEQIRDIINHDNYTLQRIHLYNHMIKENHFLLVEYQNNSAHTTERIGTFREAMNAVIVAVEGIESEKNRKIGTFIEIILFVFSSIGLYSVIFEIIRFLYDKELVTIFNIVTTKDIFYISTFVILSLIYLIIAKKRE